MKPSRTYQVLEYVSEEGKNPYRVWLDSLDTPVKARIQARVFRFESGNLGDYKPVGDGVWEAKFDFGPGYRVYFGIEGKMVILLLLGGDKKSQRRDIQTARRLWSDYLEGK